VLDSGLVDVINAMIWSFVGGLAVIIFILIYYGAGPEE